MDEGKFLVSNYTDPAPGSLDVPWWSFSIDVLLKLALVIALIYLSLWLLRRFTKAAGRVGLGGSAIAVLEHVALTPNRSLYLVELGDKVLLLGATQTQLTTLTEVAEPAEVAALRGLVRPAATPAIQPFGKQLRTLLDRASQPARAEAALARDDEREDDSGELERSAQEPATDQYLRDRIEALRQISGRFGPGARR